MDQRQPSAHRPIVAKEIHVRGVVQGVGFRPYVHRLARTHGVHGEVINTSAGVTLRVEAPVPDLEAFLAALPREKPPLAHIVAVDVLDRPVQGYADFSICHSRADAARTALISPDVAVCDDCHRELFDPRDRRHGYAFINCTNCGPRYTIIDDVPYDRPLTAMRGFTMCRRCQAEYDDPADRRYHAQPNACADCGPRVSLLDAARRPLSGDPVAQAARLLKEGRIVAIKGLGGFHLAADALNDAAVERLRARKHREEKPLAVMAPDLAAIAGFAHLTADEEALLGSIQRPIVLLPKRLPERLAFSVAPRNHYYGVLLPYTPLHHLLMAQGFTALVMTSGNLSDEPIAIDNDDALERLGEIADYFLVHDRPIRLRADDSITRRADGQTRLLRRSRGFVPLPIFLKEELPMLLACGGELKNTLCLTRGNQAFVSQHIGDLENLVTEAFFAQTSAHLQRILDIAPQAMACDLHPDYLSTRWALAQTALPVIQVQHHHAHVVACMAEHQLSGRVLGLAFDGTGYGADGTVWGGEVLAADEVGFARLAHLACVPMPGGASAIREPWRMALAWLHQVYGDEVWDLDLPIIRQIPRDKGDILLQMIRRRVNAPLTSSLGRLFDAAAAIIGLRRTVAFEGQAAMELEMIADGHAQGGYPFAWHPGASKQVDGGAIIRCLVEDLLRGTPAFIVSRRFHDTLIDGWASLCVSLRAESGLERVVLSGGCFQNTLLLEGLGAALRARGFKVYSHQSVPTNDGGISLGQALVAGMRMKNKSTE
jgi:hydrogenase maturation protein HypF